MASYQDDFTTGADEDLDVYDSDWVNALTASDFGVIAADDRVIANNNGGDFHCAAYEGATFANDQYAEVLMDMTGVLLGPAVRCSSTNNEGYGYLTGSGDWYLCIYDADGLDSFISSGSGATSTGTETIRIEIVGTSIEVFQGGVSFQTATDSTFTAGSPGVTAFDYDGSAWLDDFDGGDLSSGVSGTSATSLPVATSSSSGAVKHAGTSATTLSAPSSAAAGVAFTSITGASAPSLPVPTSSSPGTVKHTGTSAPSLPLPTSSASGTAKHTGSSSLLLSPPVSSALGAVAKLVAGTSTPGLPLVTSAATGSSASVTITTTSSSTVYAGLSAVYFSLDSGHTFTQKKTYRYYWWFSDEGSYKAQDAVEHDAAHTFETAGTYTVYCQCWDDSGTLLFTVTKDITVVDWDGDTLAVTNGGSYTGVRSTSGTNSTLDTPYFDHATIVSAIEGGDVLIELDADSVAFTLNGTSQMTNDIGDNVYVTSYGLGGSREAFTGVYSTIGQIDLSNLTSGALLQFQGAADSIAFADIEFFGDGVSVSSQFFCTGVSGNSVTNLLWYRCKGYDLDVPFGSSSSSGSPNNVALHNCWIRGDIEAGVYLSAKEVSLVKTKIEPPGGASHCSRVEWGQGVIFDSCEMENAAGSGRHCIKLPSRGTSASDVSERIYISRCSFTIPNGGGWGLSIGPQDSLETTLEDVNEVIISSCDFTTADGSYVIHIAGVHDCAIRSIAIYHGGTPHNRTPLFVGRRDGGDYSHRAPDNVSFDHIGFRMDADPGFGSETYMLTAPHGTNLSLRNSWVYNPGVSSSGGIVLFENFGNVAVTTAGNLSEGDGVTNVNTDPGVVSTTDYQASSTGSAIYEAGTAVNVPYDLEGGIMPTSGSVDLGPVGYNLPQPTPPVSGTKTGTSAPSLPLPLPSSSGNVVGSSVGTSTPNLPLVMSSASGTAVSSITGSSAPALPMIASSSIAVVGVALEGITWWTTSESDVVSLLSLVFTDSTWDIYTGFKIVGDVAFEYGLTVNKVTTDHEFTVIANYGHRGTATGGPARVAEYTTVTIALEEGDVDINATVDLALGTVQSGQSVPPTVIQWKRDTGVSSTFEGYQYAFVATNMWLKRPADASGGERFAFHIDPALEDMSDSRWLPGNMYGGAWLDTDGTWVRPDDEVSYGFHCGNEDSWPAYGSGFWTTGWTPAGNGTSNRPSTTGNNGWFKWADHQHADSGFGPYCLAYLNGDFGHRVAWQKTIIKMAARYLCEFPAQDVGYSNEAFWNHGKDRNRGTGRVILIGVLIWRCLEKIKNYRSSDLELNTLATDLGVRVLGHWAEIWAWIKPYALPGEDPPIYGGDWLPELRTFTKNPEYDGSKDARLRGWQPFQAGLMWWGFYHLWDALRDFGLAASTEFAQARIMMDAIAMGYGSVPGLYDVIHDWQGDHPRTPPSPLPPAGATNQLCSVNNNSGYCWPAPDTDTGSWAFEYYIYRGNDDSGEGVTDAQVAYISHRSSSSTEQSIAVFEFIKQYGLASGSKIDGIIAEYAGTHYRNHLPGEEPYAVGTSAAVLPILTSSSTGTAEGSVTGTSDPTLPMVVSDAAGKAFSTLTATSAATLPVVTAVAAGYSFATARSFAVNIDLNGNSIIQPDSEAATVVAGLDQRAGDAPFLDFIGTQAAGSGNSLSSDTTESASKFGAIRIQINGVDKWLRIYDAPD